MKKTKQYMDGYMQAIQEASKYLEQNLDNMLSITPEGEAYFLPYCIDKFKHDMTVEMEANYLSHDVDALED